MKLKKLASAVLAGALAFSLTVPAFATASDELTRGTAYEGELTAPTIKITLTDSGKVVVNPYKMQVTNPADPTGDKLTDQIVSAPLYIKNESNVALDIDAAVTGTAPTGVTFATTTTQGSKAVTTKSIFMFFEIKAAEDGTTSPFTGTSTYDAKSANQILVAAKEAKKAKVLTMGAGVDDTGAAAPTYACYRLTGDAASAPTTAWTADDAVSVSVAFTFTPTVAAATRS